MSTSKKKPEPKKQEQPAEQQQTPTEEEPVQQEVQPEPERPLAVPEPTAEERIALLESRLADVERWTTKHNRYHFGGMTG